MTAIRPRRSVLYMPGSNPRALEKAKTLAADALILDLEDAVAPEMKEMAREQVAAAVMGGGYGKREIAIRINSLDTQWGEEDLKAAAAAMPDAILLPKVSSPEAVASIAQTLKKWGTPEKTRLWAMIETPLGLFNVKEIAKAALAKENRLDCLVVGSNDLAKETRIRLVPGREPLLPWLAAMVAAARTYNLDILDGVYNTLYDDAGFRTECEQGRNFGFDGKTLIHPDQIAPANDIFAPDAAEVERAIAIVEAFELPENQGKGAISLKGRMVELLHAEMARRTVAMAEAIAEKQS